MKNCSALAALSDVFFFFAICGSRNIRMTSDDQKPVPPLFVLHEHSSAVLCCDFYPSSSYQREQSSWFLSGDVGGTVILWNLTTRRPLTSFSALEEAHRQHVNSVSQSQSAESACRASEDPSSKPDVSAKSVSFAALGPHSQSVLSVGFIPTGVTGVRKSEHRTTDKKGSSTLSTVVQPQSEGAKGGSLVGSSSAATAHLPPSPAKVPPRQRFRLTRQSPAHVASAAQSTRVPALAAEEQEHSRHAPQRASSPPPDICFYTHCRDQRVYIWSFSQPSASSTGAVPSLQLLAALTAPLHGFCPAESVSEVDGKSAKTFVAVPNDAHGEITVWEFEWRQTDRRPPRGAEDPSTAGEQDRSADARSTRESSSTEADSDEAEEVDTTGMNPMDALIARATAQERRDEKLRKRRQKGAPRGSAFDDGEGHWEGRGADDPRWPPGTVLSNSRRASFLCYVAPCAAVAVCGFSIRRLCSFSACPHFKGGIIMRLSMCADAQHLAVAFESGHVVLARYRSTLENSNANKAGGATEERPTLGSGAKFGNEHAETLRVNVVCAVRAFAESALACWWSGRRVLACSAEGGLQCYEVVPAPHDSVSGEAPSLADAPLPLQLLWSATLRKGIGSVCVQANLVIVGCWDSTLRLYDARDGRLVSILSYQQAPINEVRMAPSSIARVAAFGFDARQPRCYAPPTTRPALLGMPAESRDVSPTVSHSQEGMAAVVPFAHTHNDASLVHGHENPEEELVYLFASASKDGSVALWRVDMQLVAEKVALRVTSAS